MRIFAAKNNITMETITLTFNPNSPLGVHINAFVDDLPDAVKVSKSVRPARKRRTEKERFLDELAKAAEEARQLARKRTATRTLDDIIDEL